MWKTAGVRQNDLMEWDRLSITGNSYSNHKDIRFAGLFTFWTSGSGTHIGVRHQRASRRVGLLRRRSDRYRSGRGEVRSFETSLRAGVDFWFGYSGYNPVVDSDADIYYLQRAAHNHLYQLASANVQEAVLMPWKQDVHTIISALYALTAVCGVSMIVRIVRGMKKRKEQEAA